MASVETRVRAYLLVHGFDNQRALAATVAQPQASLWGGVGRSLCAAAASLILVNVGTYMPKTRAAFSPRIRARSLADKSA